MSDIKDQKKLTDGKGWGVVEWDRESPYKVVKDVGKKVIDVVTGTKEIKGLKEIKRLAAGMSVIKKDKKESKYFQKKKD